MGKLWIFPPRAYQVQKITVDISGTGRAHLEPFPLISVHTHTSLMIPAFRCKKKKGKQARYCCVGEHTPVSHFSRLPPEIVAPPSPSKKGKEKWCCKQCWPKLSHLPRQDRTKKPPNVALGSNAESEVGEMFKDDCEMFEDDCGHSNDESEAPTPRAPQPDRAAKRQRKDDTQSSVGTERQFAKASELLPCALCGKVCPLKVSNWICPAALLFVALSPSEVGLCTPCMKDTSTINTMVQRILWRKQVHY